MQLKVQAACIANRFAACVASPHRRDERAAVGADVRASRLAAAATTSATVARCRAAVASSARR